MTTMTHAVMEALRLLAQAQAEHIADDFPMSKKVDAAQDVLRRALGDKGVEIVTAQRTGDVWFSRSTMEARKP